MSEARLHATPGPAAVQPIDAAATGSKPAVHAGAGEFRRVLQGIGHQVDQGERLIGRALHESGSLDSAGLLALQVGIYRYSEAVDLIAKLVDRAAQTVKTTLQGSG